LFRTKSDENFLEKAQVSERTAWPVTKTARYKSWLWWIQFERTHELIRAG